ncbi:dynactin p62 [Hesseltinella vesiculosa]|uniref:Dynactin subunit 4 n=1 Tax=Hesseltinella vesiculosa TaxID=101127 RepID=A0A1X2GFI4_9FUNG|nr:dynactin p62 [Hesseltinella vesiculosa]
MMDWTPPVAGLPFVHYYCQCSSALARKEATEADRADQTVVDTLLSSQTEPYLYPLSRLYFCEDCHDIKCPSCVQDEIISYYCPNCLFEVPTASVKSEKNRCARNCFQCPVCQNTLSVMASKEAGPSAPGISSSANIGPYFLSCHVCRWNSQEIGMTFEKPTSLALQLQKQEDDQLDVQEFDHLKEHFEKHLRVGSTLPSSFLSFSSTGAFSKMMMSGGSTSSHLFDSLAPPSNPTNPSMQGRLDDITCYESDIGLQDERLQDPAKQSADTIAHLTILRDTDAIASLPQRYTQLHDQPYQIDRVQPQRIHLTIKRAKRCRHCRHILVKPEQKAQATRFKIKLVAMNYIPTIAIAALPSPSLSRTSSSSLAALITPPEPTLNLVLGQPRQFALKFVNPLYEEMSISLATPPLPEGTGHVTILAPHFSVSAYNETIEYDDDMYPVPGNKKPTPKIGNGVHERRNNFTSILVEVVPEQIGEFKIPLHVTCHYKTDEERMDASSGDIEEDFMDMDSSLDGSRRGNSSIRMDDGAKSYSFWTVIGLGTVQPS